MKNPHKTSGLIIVLVTYAVAILGGWLFLEKSASGSPPWNLFMADILATTIVFAASMALNNSSMYDPYWSVIPPLMAIYWFNMTGAQPTRPLLLLLLALFLWSIRLTTNWARDWDGMTHEDWRYRNFRQRFRRAYWLVSYGGIHLFPTLIVFFCMIPVYHAMQASPTEMNPWFIAGFLLAISGTAMELVAGGQLRKFRQHKTGRGDIISNGLWARCRHPNYLGEIMFWFGMWMFGFGSGTGHLWTIAAPVSMLLMFLFISIPWMERKILATRPRYESYQKEVPILLPLLRTRKD